MLLKKKKRTIEIPGNPKDIHMKNFGTCQESSWSRSKLQATEGCF